jgi:hypothetical protein
VAPRQAHGEDLMRRSTTLLLLGVLLALVWICKEQEMRPA